MYIGFLKCIIEYGSTLYVGMAQKKNGSIIAEALTVIQTRRSATFYGAVHS